MSEAKERLKAELRRAEEMLADPTYPGPRSDYTVAIRAGTTIDRVFGFTIDPPLVVEEDGRYLALVNEEKGTASLQRVGGWPEPPKPDPYDDDENRWAAFTDDELDHLSYHRPHRGTLTQDERPLWDEIDAELDRRKP